MYAHGASIHRMVFVRVRRRGGEAINATVDCVSSVSVHVSRWKSNNASGDTLHVSTASVEAKVTMSEWEHSLCLSPSVTPVFTSAIPLVSYSSRREHVDCQTLTGFIAQSTLYFKLEPWVRKLKTHYLKANIPSKFDCEKALKGQGLPIYSVMMQKQTTHTQKKMLTAQTEKW